MAEYSESSAAKILVAPKRVNLRDAEWYKNHSEEEGGREDVGSHGNGSHGGGRCNEREDEMELKVGNGKRGMVNGITSDQRTYLEEFTSAPCSINAGRWPTVPAAKR